MRRLVSPQGVVVVVSDEKAERLGWEPYEADQPAPKPVRKPRVKKTQD
jgi:hypothetical protein